MTLSQQQIADKTKFLTHLWIWERDLLECARRWPAWHDKANELGFSDEKIIGPWLHPDAGRHIRYHEIRQSIAI